LEGWDVNGRIMQSGILVNEKQNCTTNSTKQLIINSVMPFQIVFYLIVRIRLIITKHKGIVLLITH